jgi:hypothetical protein
MRKSPYYSVRTGRRSPGIDFSELKALFVAAFHDLRDAGYFQQVLGTQCVDGDIPGSAGADLDVFFFRKLKKRDLWPFHEKCGFWEEEDLFDVIELLHDCASRGIAGHPHSYLGCGMHYETFDREAGRKDFCAAMNEFLCDYQTGFQLTATGEVVALGPKGLRDLEHAPRPPGDPADVQDRVDAAIDKFRRRGSTAGERRDAIRDLADVLEFIRPEAKKVLTQQDEADLFNLANNFGVRHHNQRQKVHYDEAIWQSWMFYYFLATIHATTRLLDKAKNAQGTKGARRTP